MKLKFGPKEVHLNRISKVIKIEHSLAEIRFHTGDAILVRCSIEHPDGMTFSFPGTVEELKAIVAALGNAYDR